MALGDGAISSGNHSTLSAATDALPVLEALYPARWSEAALAAAGQIHGQRTLNAWRRGLDDIEDAIGRALTGIPERRPH